MKQRTTYHVTPHPEGGWQGILEGADRASVKGDNKQAVLERTIELAKNNTPSSVRIHSQEGKLQEERSYGSDPFPPKG